MPSFYGKADNMALNLKLRQHCFDMSAHKIIALLSKAIVAHKVNNIYHWESSHITITTNK